MLPTNSSSCWEYMLGPSAWLKDCCTDNEIFHIRVGGPSYSGKTSVVRYLIDADLQTSVAPTDGLEISVARFRQHLLYMYDSGSCDDDDFSTAKYVNFSPKSFDPRYPDGAVFVIDGNDRGRLPLAAKLMHEYIDAYYKTSVFLILVAKCDLMTTAADAHSDAPRPGISPRRLCDNFMRPSPTANARASPLHYAREELVETMHTPTTATHARNESLESRDKALAATSNVCNLREITRVMTHPSLMQKEWRIFFCSAVNGDGIDEAFEWFVAAMLAQRRKRRTLL
eukprot:Gregarina_sp_Pseudo_9__1057@NODE_1686_length_1400_cov_49_545187_g1562_i0_p1_GENE_NODE_1686_length_1400_cov_49_545187_g1562_i0NODE_1686_length_1400_cov_49_545187_g1562_i0_p1_ORF_typecomplete_len284_score55_75Arf/PF00025_21/1_8e09Arf/PF00025_21/3_6e05Ras/PF00071_22/6_6e06GTP_EFTU/PF00009_27/8_5e02GTP_EFTU/PF00009_27/0_05SRPRB/PF09439_10/0_093Roc/PF08477_13/0_038Roc/PF08477_13/1e04CPT/PF07931_12/0_22_NODE_1686_length_1400_cov_49_545187_g1562_i03181169